MAVIYLFDCEKKLKKTVKKVSEIIHREGEYQAEAHITAKDSPDNGDFFGFMCEDGLFRMFLINAVDEDDETGECTLTGIDAAAAELDGIVVESLRLENISPIDALYDALDGKGWNVRFLTSGDDFTAPAVYYQTAWTVLETISRYGNVRLQMEYAFSGGKIAQKIIWVRPRDEGFSGLIYTRKKGARNIQITKEGTPYGRVYPIGKVIGDEEPPEQVTIADEVWSVANGDPTDKPAGQTWIAIPGAKSDAGYVYEDKTETDPLALMKKGFADLESKQHWKASGTALISDMETVGWQNRGAKMWQSIAIRTESGQTIEATILNIERYYVRKELTKVTVGEETTLEDQIIGMNTLLAETVKAAGGAGAGAGKAKKMVLEAEELIQLNSQRIEANAEQLITLRVATEEARTELDETIVSFNETKLTIEELKGELSTTKTDVNNATNEVNQLKGSVTTLAGEVELKASQSSLDDLGNLVEEHEAYIRVLPGQIEAKADLILLEGYVKASQLETTNAKISNLMSGSTQAMAIDTLLLTANQVNSQFVKAASLSLGDNTMQIRTISMGDVASVRALVTGVTGNVELEHSHAVIENEDGTITLGEVSSAGGSFKIADTKAYKEGVSAAKESVSLSTAGWMGPGGTNTVIASNGKSIIVSLPEFSVSGGDTWSSEHKTTINFTTPSVVGQPVKQVIVDAGEVYADGYAAGTAVGSGASYNDGYQAGKDAYKPTEIVRETYSIANKTISVRAQNSYQALLTGIAVDASEIYDAGAENVSLSSAGWIRGQNVVTASNGRTLAVDLPPFSTGVGVWDLTNIKTTAYFYTPSIDAPVAQCEVNGIEPYNLGAGSVRLSSDGWINGVNTVEASNGKTFEVGLPDVSLSGGENWDPEEHTTTVFASVMGVGLPIAQMDVDASIIYDLGKAEVEITSGGWINGENVVTASNGKKATIKLPEFSVSGGDTWTSNKTTVYFSTPSVNVPLKKAEINAGSVYTNGQNSVTISAGNWQDGETVVTASNGKSAIVQLPAFSASESEWSGNKKSIYFSTASVSVPLKTVEVDARSIYANGQNSVNLSEEGWKGPNGTNTVKASNGQSLIVNLPAFSVSGGEAWAGNKTTVYFSTQSVNTPLASMEVDARAVYRNGVNAVTLSTAGWAAPNGTNVVEASNGRTLIINLPEFNVSGGETWTENKTTVYFSTASVNVPLKSVEVDASSVYSEGVKAGSGSGYNSGYAAGKEAYAPTAISRTAYDAETKTITVKAANKHQDLLTNQTIDISDIFEAAYTAGFEGAKSLTEVRGEITSIKNTAPNTFYATGYARALVNEEQVDSTTFYATQEIKVGQ